MYGLWVRKGARIEAEPETHLAFYFIRGALYMRVPNGLDLLLFCHHVFHLKSKHLYLL